MPVDTFLELSDIEGEAEQSGYENQIEVLSWSWNVTNPGSYSSTGGGSATLGQGGELAFTHYMDKASANLMKYACNGQGIAEAKLTKLKSGGSDPVTSVEMIMTDCKISSVSPGGASEDQCVESVTINFAKVEFNITPQKADQTGDSAQNMSWDFRTGTE